MLRRIAAALNKRVEIRFVTDPAAGVGYRMDDDGARYWSRAP